MPGDVPESVGPLARLREGGELDEASDETLFEPPLILQGDVEQPSRTLVRLRAEER